MNGDIRAHPLHDLVPPGIDVRTAGTAVLAERSVDVRGEVPPGAPILVVEGRASLSSVSVRTSGSG